MQVFFAYEATLINGLDTSEAGINVSYLLTTDLIGGEYDGKSIQDVFIETAYNEAKTQGYE